MNDLSDGRRIKWVKPAPGQTLEDGEGVRAAMVFMDAGIPREMVDAAQRMASEASHQAMRQHLRDAWKGQDAPASPSQADRDATMAASVAAAEATAQRVADRRQDATAEHRAMVDHITNAWRGDAA